MIWNSFFPPDVHKLCCVCLCVLCDDYVILEQEESSFSHKVIKHGSQGHKQLSRYFVLDKVFQQINGLTFVLTDDNTQTLQ